jgi:hypothetical protein
MAGDNIFKDPAIERWADMRENTVQYFRWNRRNIRIALLFGVVVPIGVYTLAKYTTVSKQINISP